MANWILIILEKWSINQFFSNKIYIDWELTYCNKTAVKVKKQQMSLFENKGKNSRSDVMTFINHKMSAEWKLGFLWKGAMTTLLRSTVRNAWTKFYIENCVFDRLYIAKFLCMIKPFQKGRSKYNLSTQW